MALLCGMCPICLAPPGYPHAEGCDVDPGAPRAPAPTAADRAAVVEATNARALEAWIRGGRLPTPTGYRPPDAPEFP